MTHILERLQSDAATERARKMRRGFPIHFYSGKNGGSKSACMVFDTLPDLDQGKSVLSTVRLLDYRNLRPCESVAADLCDDPVGHLRGHMAAHPSYVPFVDWQQLLEWSGGPILMDEITGVADSNEGAAVPAAVANKLAQLRRADVTVRITGLNFIRANKRIREAVTAITRCSASWGVIVTSEDGSERVWKQNRWASWRTYDAQSLPLDDHTEAAYEKAELLTATHHWLPKSPAITAYDTYAPVLTVGHVSEHGRCVRCDGNRRVQECQCEDYQQKKAGRPARTARAQPADRSGRLAADLDVSTAELVHVFPAQAASIS
jgi:hypothetical protein